MKVVAHPLSCSKTLYNNFLRIIFLQKNTIFISFFEESSYKNSNFQTKVNRKSKNGHFWYVHF